jgi:hypothetical protein
LFRKVEKQREKVSLRAGVVLLGPQSFPNLRDDCFIDSFSIRDYSKFNMIVVKFPQKQMLLLVLTISSLWCSMTSINQSTRDMTALHQGDALTHKLSNFEHDINGILPEEMQWSRLGPKSRARSNASAGLQDIIVHLHHLHHHALKNAAARDNPRSDQQHQSQSNQPRSLDDRNDTTLALLYPSGLIGGYRNQAMRFIAFCKHAMDHNITQLLLPTLLWGTRYHNQFPIFFWPVPFQELFDVDHWNSYHYSYHDDQWDPKTATLLTSESPSTIRLPLLVDSTQNSDCWRDTPYTTEEVDQLLQRLYGGNNYYYHDSTITRSNKPTTPIRMGEWFIPKLTEKVVINAALRLEPLADATVDFLSGRLGTAFRKMDFRHQVQQCRHPKIYGGGTGAGVLWNDYLSMPQLEPHYPRQNAKPYAVHNTNLIATIHRALIPAPKWRHLATQCLQHHLNRTNDSSGSSSYPSQMVSGYVALHARVEAEMMVHKCGQDMEKNLTTILDMVDGFIDTYNNIEAWSPPNRQQQQLLHGILIAVGREGMEEKNYRHVAEMAEYNWKVLNERSMSIVNGRYTIQKNLDSNTKSSTSNLHTRERKSNMDTAQKTVPAFECGEGWVEEAFYNDIHNNHDGLPHNYYGSILPSIVNFWLAVEADIFVGVMKSSWSTDVWTTRYYQGKGQKNFQYTIDHGIIPVPNRGLPPPHRNC